MSSIAKIAFGLLPLGLVALTSACTVPPPVQCDFTPMRQAQMQDGPVLVPMTPGTLEPVSLNTVAVTDVGINRKVLAQSVHAGRTATGNMTVETRLMNCTDHPLQVDGRTNFMTGGGGQAEQPSAWQRIYLPARSMASYTENSISGPRAESFLIEIKEAR